MAPSGIPLCAAGDGCVSKEAKFSLGGRLISKGWLALALVILGGFYFYSKRQSYDNPNPLRRVETSESYIWPEGCTKEDYKKSKIEYGSQIPCACADPKHEIKDWYERGLSPWGEKNIRYYRIENAAVGITQKTRFSVKNCRNRTDNAYGYEEFFIQTDRGSVK
jgi:hypothetical protein